MFQIGQNEFRNKLYKFERNYIKVMDNIKFPEKEKSQQDEVEDDGIHCYLMSSGQMIITTEEETEEGIFFNNPFIAIMIPQAGGQIGIIFQPISAFTDGEKFGPVNFAGVLFEVPLREALLDAYRNQVQELRARKSGLTIARNIPDIRNFDDKQGKS